MSDLQRRALRFAAQALSSGVDSATTIAARTRMLSSPDLAGSDATARETMRMTQEKFVAVWEGVFGAQMAWGAFLAKAVLGGVRDANDVARGLADVSEAAFAPARKKVRANARRLTRSTRLG